MFLKKKQPFILLEVLLSLSLLLLALSCFLPVMKISLQKLKREEKSYELIQQIDEQFLIHKSRLKYSSLIKQLNPSEKTVFAKSEIQMTNQVYPLTFSVFLLKQKPQALLLELQIELGIPRETLPKKFTQIYCLKKEDSAMK